LLCFTALFFCFVFEGGGSRSATDLVFLLALFTFPVSLFYLLFFLRFRRVCLCLHGSLVCGDTVGGDGSRLADLVVVVVVADAFL
jgi:hypothetical protein